jgi:hypothetical protein
MFDRTPVTIATLTAGTALLAGLVATTGCEYGSAQGDRYMTGECPERNCSDQASAGLIFYGQAFYDDAGDDRLGPVAQDGRFTLRFGSANGEELTDWDVEITPAGAIETEIVGYQTIRLTGRMAADATVRIVDSRNGFLIDQIPFRVAAIDEVVVGDAKSDDDFLVAGCTQMVGIDLWSDGIAGSSKVFDMQVGLEVDGEATWEAWDCYQVDVPEGVDELPMTVITASGSYEVSMPVVPNTGNCPGVWLD